MSHPTLLWNQNLYEIWECSCSRWNYCCFKMYSDGNIRFERVGLIQVFSVQQIFWRGWFVSLLLSWEFLKLPHPRNPYKYTYRKYEDPERVLKMQVRPTDEKDAMTPKQKLIEQMLYIISFDCNEKALFLNLIYLQTSTFKSTDSLSSTLSSIFLAWCLIWH